MQAPTCSSSAAASSPARTCHAHTAASSRRWHERRLDGTEMSLQRALELGEAARGTGYPKPTVAAVLVRDGEIVGEGWTEAGGRHGEIVALAAAGERARGATLYVTM